MEEIWKDIEGYEGYYQVSNLGRVKGLDRYITSTAGNLRFVPSKFLIDRLDSGGYMYYGLRKSGKKNFRTHRLVAKYFIPNPENKPQVNHIDGNKLNNSIENLEWVTQSENEKHAYALGLKNQKGSKNNTAKLNEKQALEIYELAWEGILTRREIGEMYNTGSQNVYRIKHKKRWSHIHK